MPRSVVAGAVLLVAVVALAAWALLSSPTSGAEWRLGPAAWHEPFSTDQEPRAIVYPAGPEEVGIGVTVFGSSSCPPRLRDVRIGSAMVSVEVRRDVMLVGGCTDDLATHQFGILVERDAMPPLPFTVMVRHAESVGDTEVEFEVTSLP
jgi:hypothetical protein